MNVPPSAFKLAASGVKKAIGEQTVRERLVKLLKKKLREVPSAPKLTWATRRRLMTLLADVNAEGFLMDQDGQGVDALSSLTDRAAAKVTTHQTPPAGLITGRTACNEHSGYPCLQPWTFAINAVLPPAAGKNANWTVAPTASLMLSWD